MSTKNEKQTIVISATSSIGRALFKQFCGNPNAFVVLSNVRGRPRSIIKAVKGACSATSELQDDADEAEEDAEEGAGEDLPEGVLAQ